MKGPIADDDAKIDPNDGHGDNVSKNGVGSEGEDANADDDEEESRDCSWMSISTPEETLGNRGPTTEDDAKMDPKDGDGDGGKKNAADPDREDNDSMEGDGDNADVHESLKSEE